MRLSAEFDQPSYDLRPHVARIMAGVRRKLEALPDGETLYLFMGEEHGVPADKVMQQMVLDELTAKILTAFNYESPKNDLGLMLSLRSAEKIDRATFLLFNRLDRKGELLARANLSFKPEKMHDAPIAGFQLYKFCLDHGINFQSSDAIRTEDGYHVDISQLPQTSAIQKLVGNAEEIANWGYPGFQIRNHVRLAGIKNHAAEHGCRVTVVQAGTFHLAGVANCQTENCDDRPYKDSLMDLFIEAGETVLGVLPFYGQFGMEQMHPAAQRLITAGGLLPIYGTPRTWFTAHQRFEESEHIQKLYSASGGKHTLCDVDTVQQENERYIRAVAPRLVRQIRELNI